MSKIDADVQAPPPLIKVGQTGLNDLAERRNNLNTGNPYRLDYVERCRWRVKNTNIGEKWAHASLVGLEAKPLYGGGQEWFRLPPLGLDRACELIEEGLELSGELE